jgi:calcium-translocating P-type ATPase
VILVNGAFSFWQEYRAERALGALRALLPNTTNVLRDGRTVSLPAAGLVPGDVILLEEGDDVPADCRLVEAFGVRVNTAAISGESFPQVRHADPHQENDFAHSANILLAGTSLAAGQAKAIVFATGGHTVFGDIARLAQAARAPLSPLQKEIVRLSRVIAVFTLALGIFFFLIGRAIGLSFWENFIFAIGIIVANVPEGLLPTVTLSLAMGSQRMARRNALIRHLPAVETLGCATVICTDKTGTLTLNRMQVTRVFADGEFHGNADVATLRANPRLFEVARFCHNLKQVEENGRSEWKGDPMEIALLELATQAGLSAGDYPRVDEVAFDSRRKRLSTIHNTTEGLRIYTKGAPESVLRCCTDAHTEHGLEAINPTLLQQVTDAQNTMAGDGLRVLALAYRDVKAVSGPAEWEAEMTFAGLVGLEDPPRPETTDALESCRAAGIKVIMITGDHPLTAGAIARQIGLAKAPSIVSGEELQHLSETQLQLVLDAPEILFARVAPEQKMEIVAALKRKGHVVAVTGDGVNDAPALKHADIGIAMGRTGTDVARETADMVLLDDNFASIVAAIEEGRAVFANIRKFLTYVLSSNVAELVPFLAFVLFKIPLPITIIQVLAVDLGTDMIPALGLGAEPPHPGVMKSPPRRRSERLLDWRVLILSYGWLGAMEAAAAMAAYFFILRSGGWHYGEALTRNDPLHLQATTACFSAIVMTQVANVFLCRSQRESSLMFGLWSNPLLLFGVAIEICLLFIIGYTPWGNTVFGTAPIPTAVWLLILPLVLAMLALEELRKWIVRSWFDIPSPAASPGKICA